MSDFFNFTPQSIIRTLTITIDNLLQAVIIFQGFLLALFLFLHKKGKRTSHRLLGIILFILAWQMLGIFLGNIGIGKNYFESTNCLYGFLYGPFFFLYTNSITKKSFSFKRIDLLHFIPFVLSVAGIIISKGAFCQPRVYVLYVSSILIYILLSFVRIRRYQNVVKNTYARMEMMRLDWLQWAFVLFSLVVLSDIFAFAFFMMDMPTSFMDIMVLVFILVFINTLYFKGLQQAEIFSGFSKEDAQLSDELKSLQKPAAPYEIEWIQQLKDHMEQEKPFRNPNLSIADLADQLQIPKRKLSELINAHFQQNFVDFINTYRIEEAKARFRNPADEKETILEVMYDVGFNSKSSFNTIFKKKTGMTPSQFKG